MHKLKLLFSSKPKNDILVWDTMSINKIQRAIGNYRWEAVDCRNKIYIAPLYLLKSLFVLIKKYKNLRYCNLFALKPSSPKTINAILRNYIGSFKTISVAVLGLSTVFHYKPKLLITYIDNSYYFQCLDALLHELIPVITIQNGSRWHAKSISKGNTLRYSIFKSSFHSCFAALGPIDIDMYRDNGWKCLQFRNIGSVSADTYFNDQSIEIKYDICIIAGSLNTRLTDFKLSELINRYSKNRSVKVIVALKRGVDDPGFGDHYDELDKLYGDCAELIPLNDSSINLARRSNVITGTFSTALRELFSIGKKIYPISFEAEGANVYWEKLNINQSPSQSEFNDYLNHLLSIDQGEYQKQFSSEMKYIGAFPMEPRPLARLQKLVDSKLGFNK